VLWACKSTKNDQIGIHLPVPEGCWPEKLRIMMKFGFTYLFLWLWASKPMNNDEIGIHLPVRVCWQTWLKL
jgi:hypothetical protein